MRRLIIFCLMFFSLLGLGTWQVFRLQEKNHILETIAIKMTKPLENVSSSGNFQKHLYSNVKIKGTLLYEKTLLYYRLLENTPGYEVITPVLVGDNILLVSRGWATEYSIEEEAAYITSLNGMLIPLYKKNLINPDRDKEKNIWFDLDLENLRSYVGNKEILPYILLLKQPLSVVVGKKSVTVDIRSISNNHMQYAITWFVLAGILLVMFIIDTKKRGTNECVCKN